MNVLEIKATVRARDRNRCLGCGMTSAEHRDRYRKKLEVHRLAPGSPYSQDGCVTLCRRCHRRRHMKRLSGPLPRMIIDTRDEFRRAVKLRALKLSRPGHEVSYSDVVNAILCGEQPPLTREIEEVSGYGEAETGKKPRPKPKP